MTVVATFSSTTATYLIADTLVTRDVVTAENRRLSTGVLVERGTPMMRDELLKVWPLQDNLAIGHAGQVPAGTKVLVRIASQISSKPFDRAKDLLAFIERHGPRTLAPIDGVVELCGFLIEGQRHVKFACTLDANGITRLRTTTDRDAYFVVGMGKDPVAQIICRASRVLGSPASPDAILRLIEDQLYVIQFVRPDELVHSRSTGGAIVGVYSTGHGIQWSESRTIIPLFNTGGVALDARFEWTRVVHKTFVDRGSVFSLAVFADEGQACSLRLTEYRNPLSARDPLTADNIPAEARSPNATNNTVMLLSGRGGEYPAAVNVVGMSPFEGHGVAGLPVRFRFRHEFLDQASARIFVRDDGTIAINDGALVAKADWASNQLSADDGRSPETTLRLLQVRADALTKLGLARCDVALLRGALSGWLDTWELCSSKCVAALSAAMQNVQTFLGELRKQCEHVRRQALAGMDGRIASFSRAIADLDSDPA